MGQICLPPKIPRDSQPSIAPNSNVETSVSRASEHCGPHTIFVARESRKNPIAPLERKSRNSNPIGKNDRSRAKGGKPVQGRHQTGSSESQLRHLDLRLPSASAMKFSFSIPGVR